LPPIKLVKQQAPPAVDLNNFLKNITW